MDRLKNYRTVVKQVINDYAQYKPSVGDIEVETVFDEESDHYEMLYIGWNDGERVHGTVIHIDIREGKIWVHYDGTATGIAEDLAAAGIPRDQIILGWHPPEIRQDSSYEFGRIEEAVT